MYDASIQQEMKLINRLEELEKKIKKIMEQKNEAIEERMKKNNADFLHRFSTLSKLIQENTKVASSAHDEIGVIKDKLQGIMYVNEFEQYTNNTQKIIEEFKISFKNNEIYFLKEQQKPF